jgi:hypothetical protein
VVLPLVAPLVAPWIAPLDAPWKWKGDIAEGDIAGVATGSPSRSKSGSLDAWNNLSD